MAIEENQIEENQTEENQTSSTPTWMTSLSFPGGIIHQCV
jgi:hypothetical protein